MVCDTYQHAIDEKHLAVNRDNSDHWRTREGLQGGLAHKLRLIHTVLHDLLKEDFVQRDDTYSREELDARNQIKTFWQMVADKFNDPDFEPDSLALESAWGHWFEVSRQLPNKITSRPIEEANAKKDFRKMMNETTQIIANRKASGAGRGMKAL
jgi:hypothetical protein